MYSEKEYNKAVDLLGALGFVYAEKEDYPEAQKIFEIVSKFKKDLGSFGIGYAFALQDENMDALAAFDKAIELNPQYSEAWYSKGSALKTLHREAKQRRRFPEQRSLDSRGL